MTDFNNIPAALDEIKNKLDSLETFIKKYLKEEKDYPDMMSLETMLLYLKAEYDIGISRSKVYKLTQGSGSGGIPREKFCNRLVFNKKEIDAWVNVQVNTKASILKSSITTYVKKKKRI